MLYQTWGSWGFEQLRIGIYVSEWGLYLKLFQYTESWLEQKILKWGGWGAIYTEFSIGGVYQNPNI